MSLKNICLWFLPLTLLVSCSTDTKDAPAELVTFAEEARLKRVWSRDVGAGSGHYQVALEPYFSDEALYSIDHEGLIYAIDTKSGKVLWKRSTDEIVTAGLGATYDALLYGTTQGGLVAIDIENGEEKWRTQLSSIMNSIPAFDNGMLVVRTVDGYVRGLSPLNGSQRWAYKLSVPELELTGNSNPLAIGGVIIVGTDTGRMIGLASQDGRTLWDVPVGAASGRSQLERMIDINMTPSLDNTILYIGAYQSKLAAFELQEGKVLWTRDKSTYNSVALDKENVYVSDGRSHVWALDKKSGSTKWVQDALNARRISAPLSFGDYIVVVDFEGYAHVLSKADGRFITRVQTDSSGFVYKPFMSPNEDDSFYVLNKNGELGIYEIAPIDQVTP